MPFNQHPTNYSQLSHHNANHALYMQQQNYQLYQPSTNFILSHPQNQFGANSINQPQNTQARTLDQRRNTLAITGYHQLQSQGTQSQKSLGIKQTDTRRPLIEKVSNQRSVSQSPAKIIFNYNVNSANPTLIIKPGFAVNQQPHSQLIKSS